MDFNTILSQRIGINDIREINKLIGTSDKYRQDLYALLFDSNSVVAYQAAWIFSHFEDKDNWLYQRQDELIDEALTCEHGGKKRLLLNILYMQPLDQIERVDFLDFCLEAMVSVKELPAIRSLSMKIAYEICLQIPELLQEYKFTLDILQGDLTPAVNAVRRNIQKAIKKSKSIQKLRK